MGQRKGKRPIVGRKAKPLLERLDIVETWKIEEFREEYPETEVPWYRELTPCDLKELAGRCVAKYGAAAMKGVASVSEAMLRIAMCKGRHLGDAGNFFEKDVGAFLEKHVNFDFPCRVILDASTFSPPESVDEVRFKDLINYYDVFAGGIADATIFDVSLNWVLAVTHDAEVYFYNSAK